MGSCCSCLCTDSIPDNHPTKFKVTNVDDEGHELGSGVMELTQRELILHTHKRDAVRWPYLCLRRYGFDSNLFSFESGRRCHTGQGIFAFKCSRAEEIFNLLQELMQCNSINVVEEPVVITRNSHPSDREPARSPQPPTTLGYTGLPNGFHSFPGESLSYSAARHPSVSSLRHSSVGEDSTHPLLGPEEQSHTYVNTATGEPEPRGRHCMHSLPEAHPPFPPRNHSCSLEDQNPQVFLQPAGEVKFVLAPPSGYRRLCRHPRECRAHLCPPNNNNNECQEGCPSPQCRRGAAPPPATPSPNGFSEAGEEEPLQNSLSSESAALQPRRSFLPRARRSRLPNVFSFDSPRPCPEPPRQLNYIQVELEPEPCKGQQDPRVPPPASPGGRHTDSYAVIDLKKTAAMSSLQRALPRDDGTSRKTRHNSTDLPL
ncbi:PREDICTED: fibroblast growth factor receptor substrate 3 [Corvus brachyrhynchos]|uniref:fibroblast growth factor receptor substrate 3 n=1 Tax=Corvus brachyrhynchos TaxID=85066 RepID=UPI0004DDE5F5|nr:PREDICTED: fibroblast growth factor receptor substrate 3 [Corvus brachyrhynchos]